MRTGGPRAWLSETAGQLLPYIPFITAGLCRDMRRLAVSPLIAAGTLAALALVIWLLAPRETISDEEIAAREQELAVMLDAASAEVLRQAAGRASVGVRWLLQSCGHGPDCGEGSCASGDTAICDDDQALVWIGAWLARQDPAILAVTAGHEVHHLTVRRIVLYRVAPAARVIAAALAGWLLSGWAFPVGLAVLQVAWMVTQWADELACDGAGIRLGGATAECAYWDLRRRGRRGWRDSMAVAWAVPRMLADPPSHPPAALRRARAAFSSRNAQRVSQRDASQVRAPR